MGQTLSNELLQAMERERGLMSVNMANSNLTDVEPELLATAVRGLEEVNMSRTQLTNQQAEARDGLC